MDIKTKVQDEVLGKLRDLLTDCEKILRKGLNAIKPCGFCLDGKPKKTTQSGQCIACKGENVIDDAPRQQWAFEQVYGRLAPMAKSVEMKVEDNRDKEELAKQYKDLKDPKKINELIAAMDRAATEGTKLSVVNDDGNG